MNGFKSYLEWRGDLSMLSVLPNEIDLLIFSQLVHAPLENIPSLNGQTLAELTSWVYPEAITGDERQLAYLRYQLWQQICSCERFSQVKLSRFVARFDPVTQKQFAAACFIIGNIGIVTYRGTDATLIGWKEDFNLAFENAVPAQLEAVDFLNQCESRTEYLYICGHSKGGNLAVYAASHCNPEILRRVLGIVNFDGPGLTDGIIENSHWNDIRHLMRIFVPESSIIGMLFNSRNTPIIVKSDSVSILQHNPFYWHITGPNFVQAERNSFSSRFIEDTVNYFLNHCSAEQRRTLIDTLYDLLKVSKAKYLRNIPAGIIKNRLELHNTIQKCSPEVRKELADIAQIAVNAIGDSIAKNSLPPALRYMLQELTDGFTPDNRKENSPVLLSSCPPIE